MQLLIHNYQDFLFHLANVLLISLHTMPCVTASSLPNVCHGFVRDDYQWNRTILTASTFGKNCYFVPRDIFEKSHRVTATASIRFNDKYHVLFYPNQSVAHDICGAHNAHLPIVKTKEEAEFLLTFLKWEYHNSTPFWWLYLMEAEKSRRLQFDERPIEEPVPKGLMLGITDEYKTGVAVWADGTPIDEYYIPKRYMTEETYVLTDDIMGQRYLTNRSGEPVWIFMNKVFMLLPLGAVCQQSTESETDSFEIACADYLKKQRGCPSSAGGAIRNMGRQIWMVFMMLVVFFA